MSYVDYDPYKSYKFATEWIYDKRSVIGAVFSLWIAIQFALLIAIFDGYISNWPGVLTPTYFLVACIIVGFFLVMILSGASWCNLDTFCTLLWITGVIVFTVMLPIKLHIPDSMSYFTLFFPTAVIFLILLILFCFRFPKEYGAPRNGYSKDIADGSDVD